MAKTLTHTHTADCMSEWAEARRDLMTPQTIAANHRLHMSDDGVTCDLLTTDGPCDRVFMHVGDCLHATTVDCCNGWDERCLDCGALHV
jgi:hypothetical protein